MWMTFLRTFLVGGGLCLIGQLLIDLTAMTPARILVTYVVSGVFLGAVGVYEPLAEFAFFLIDDDKRFLFPVKNHTGLSAEFQAVRMFTAYLIGAYHGDRINRQSADITVKQTVS